MYMRCYGVATANDRVWAHAPRQASDAPPRDPPTLVGSTEEAFRHECGSKVLKWLKTGYLCAVQRMRRNEWRSEDVFGCWYYGKYQADWAHTADMEQT